MEIQIIIKELRNTLEGDPWFGRPVYELLEEVDPAVIYDKANADSHSLADLLYHMLTWSQFTLRRIEGDKEQDLAAFEKMDWRNIDPAVHTWERGVKEFKQTNNDIIAVLETKSDDFLENIVDYRKYNFRFLLNGLIQHHIYHAGQVAYAWKERGRRNVK